MLPILKAALSSAKAFAVTATGKVVVVAVLGTTVIGGTSAAVYNTSVQPVQGQAKMAVTTTEASNMADTSSTISSDSTAAAASSDTSSAATNSQTTGNSEIDSAVSAGIQQINSATSKAVSEVQQAASSRSDSPAQGDSYVPPKTDFQYPVIDPNTGSLVGYGEPNYAKFKAELGGDAGIVMPDDSKAIATARAKLKAASEAAASSSATSN